MSYPDPYGYSASSYNSFYAQTGGSLSNDNCQSSQTFSKSTQNWASNSTPSGNNEYLLKQLANSNSSSHYHTGSSVTFRVYPTHNRPWN